MMTREYILIEMSNARPSWASDQMSKAVDISHEEVKREIRSMARERLVTALEYQGIISFCITDDGKSARRILLERLG